MRGDNRISLILLVCCAVISTFIAFRSFRSMNPDGDSSFHQLKTRFVKLNENRRKIYFAGSIRGGRQDATLYRQLIDHMAKAHGTVLTEHVGEASLQSMGEMGTRDKLIYERDMAWLRSAHAVVAEVTRASLGVGYEIAYAEQLRIPVLCLYRPKANKGGRLSAMIGGSSWVRNRQYETQAQAVVLIDQFFGDVDSGAWPASRGGKGTP